MTFLAELRRRKVSRTAVLYAVVAWAVIETSSVILPALRLPDWTVTFVVVLALLGFPVVLIFAWVFDWTRQGFIRTPGKDELPPAQARSFPRGRIFDFAIIAVLLGVVGWLGWERAFDRDGPGDGTTLDSIAVLPFVNMSGDPENEYFSDGLAEELLNALVSVDGLRVAARTSSFQYKGRNIDIRQIAEALGVASVLEGSVRKSGDRVRVTVQLIRASDGFHLWSDSFDRRLEDIFAVQDEIAVSITEALRMTLGAGERERMTARSTQDVEAFEAYLRGRFEMQKRSPATLRRAVEEFREAIRRDASYAAAYSGLADTWLLLSDYGGVPAGEALRQAEPMARRALELDPQLGEAHASMGLILREKGDIVGSIAPLRRAIELNPSYSPAHHWLSLSYADTGRFREAVEAGRAALAVDPEYRMGKRVLLLSLRNIGEHAEADALAARLEREHGDEPLILYGLADDAMQRGDLLKAIPLAVRAVRLDPHAAHIRQLLANQLLIIGDVERAERQMQIAAADAPDDIGVRFWRGFRALALGDRKTLLAETESYVPTLPAGIERSRLACTMYAAAGAPELAIEHCQEALERLGWERGQPLPPDGIDPAAILLIAAAELGDREIVAEMDPLLEDEVERMAGSGMDPERVELIRTLIRMHRGDPDPFLERLPAMSPTELKFLGNLETNPLFAPVRDDPRFQAGVEQQRERLAAVRQEIDRLEMPE